MELMSIKNSTKKLDTVYALQYEEMLEAAQMDVAINEAEKEFASGGELLDARDALSSLRRKHFG